MASCKVINVALSRRICYNFVQYLTLVEADASVNELGTDIGTRRIHAGLDHTRLAEIGATDISELWMGGSNAGFCVCSVDATRLLRSQLVLRRGELVLNFYLGSVVSEVRS